jgi:uncharacterized protein
MSDDVMRAWIRQVIEGHRTPELTIALQGGEPTLMGVDFLRRVISYAREVAGPRRPIEFTMQTNGTLLDDEWCELLAAERVLVGLSLDGPAAMHDAYRVDKQGRPTHDRVITAWNLLQRHGVDTNVLCSVHAANGDHGIEVYRYFRDDLGVRFIQFLPIVERTTPETAQAAELGWGARASERPLYVQRGSGTTSRSVTPRQWGAFLVEVFDEWVFHDVGEVFVPMFDDALGSWLGMPSTMCIFAERCGGAIALEHDGDVYSCDHYVEPGYRLGDVMTSTLIELVSSPQQRAFGDAKADLPTKCRECTVRFACHGECPRNRFDPSPAGEPALNHLCEGYFEFFTHIDRPMRIMADLLRTGRPADAIMEILADGPQSGC